MSADAMRDFPVANNQASVVRSLGVCPDRGACPGTDYLITLYQCHLPSGACPYYLLNALASDNKCSDSQGCKDISVLDQRPRTYA